MRFHYAKIITLCCFLFMFVCVGFANASFGIYQPYLVSLPFVGNTGGSIVLTVRTLASSVVLLFVDRLYASLGMRKTIAIAMLCTVVGFVLYSVAQSFAVLLVGAVFAGASFGLGGMVAMTMMISRWYATGRGKALGLASIGSSVACLIVPLVAVRIINAASLSAAFLVESLTAAVLAVIVFAFLRDDPKEKGLQPFAGGSEQKKASPVARHRFRPLSRGARVLLYVAITAVGGVCMSAATYSAVYLTTSGYEEHFVASIVSVAAIFLIASKFVAGGLFDRVGGERASLLFVGIGVAGLALLIAAGPVHNPVVAAVGNFATSAGLVLGSIGVSEWSMDFAPANSLGTFTKNNQIAYVAGGVIFNLIPGPLADLMGSYQYTYIILLALLVITAVSIRFIYARYRVKDEA